MVIINKNCRIETNLRSIIVANGDRGHDEDIMGQSPVIKCNKNGDKG